MHARVVLEGAPLREVSSFQGSSAQKVLKDLSNYNNP